MDIDHDTFTVVFEQLPACLEEPQVSSVEATRTEIDEIDHLRRLVLEVIEPEPMSYTTTWPGRFA